MENEVLIDTQNYSYIINEPDFVEARVSTLANTDATMEEMQQFIKTEKHTIFHFDGKLKTKEAGDPDITIAWLDSGYYTPKGEAIFISLRKSYYNDFSGYFVGTAQFLAIGMKNKEYDAHTTKAIQNNLPKFQSEYEFKIKDRDKQHISFTKKDTVTDFRCVNTLSSFQNHNSIVSDNSQNLQETNESRIPAALPKKLTAVTERIYNDLLFKNWHSMNGLDRYLKIIGKRIEQLLDKNREEFYVVNTSIKAVIINSGLLNSFENDYLILYKYYEHYKTYVAEQVIEGKQDFLDNRFTIEQATKVLQPISFFEENEKNFTLTEYNVDLSQKALHHIINERRERFPENLQNESADKIAKFLENALKRGIQMQKRDNSYVKAFYSGKTRNIALLMPLHINAKITEEPELVMVINKSSDFYEVKTVLPFDDDLKDRITAISLYRQNW